MYKFMIFMLLLIAIIPLSLGTWALAGYTAAQTVSILGTAIVVLGTLVYVAVWDGRSRWPGSTTGQRLHNVLTFTR